MQVNSDAGGKAQIGCTVNGNPECKNEEPSISDHAGYNVKNFKCFEDCCSATISTFSYNQSYNVEVCMTCDKEQEYCSGEKDYLFGTEGEIQEVDENGNPVRKLN